MRLLVSAFAVALAIASAQGCGRMLCDETTTGTAPQPGGQLVASIVLRNCGATTDFATIVSLHRGDSTANTDDVLVINGRAEMSLAWEGQTKLAIVCKACPRESIVRQMSISGQVDVVLRPPSQ